MEGDAHYATLHARSSCLALATERHRKESSMRYSESVYTDYSQFLAQATQCAKDKINLFNTLVDPHPITHMLHCSIASD
jgi:hypothetical protein